jgi:hypothetical protein
MFLDHTQRRSTVGRTPLDGWSARRRDLYLTTHDTHNRQISMPPVGFQPKISAGERPAAARLLRSRWQRPATTRPTTLRVCKTWGCQCSFRLLMMGGVSPETCWAPYKYEIKFWYTAASCWIFFVKIPHFGFLLKLVFTLQLWFKSDKNNTRLTQKPTCICRYIISRHDWSYDKLLPLSKLRLKK